MGNRNPSIEEEKTTQYPKEKGQKNIENSVVVTTIYF
jgi:hypothetical protein